MFVVTGTPRSATGYAAKLFQAVGVECTHEVYFRPRITAQELLEWHAMGGRRAESSWLAWAFLPILPGPVHVLHTTRDPWQVIDSLAHRNHIINPDANMTKESLRLRLMVERYTPDVMRHEGAIARAAQLFVTWNLKIENTVARLGLQYQRYRVEDVNASYLESMMDFVGMDCDTLECQRAFAETPRSVNAGKKLDYNIEVTNPKLRAILKSSAPDCEPVIGCMMSADRRRTPDELRSRMPIHLARAVDELAHKYGYNYGAENHEPCNECAAV